MKGHKMISVKRVRSRKVKGGKKMKLNLASIRNTEEWKGFDLPAFDIASVREKTYREPVWLHFGAGNIFRAFPAVLLQKLLDKGLCCPGRDRSRRFRL